MFSEFIEAHMQKFRHFQAKKLTKNSLGDFPLASSNFVYRWSGRWVIHTCNWPAYHSESHVITHSIEYTFHSPGYTNWSIVWTARSVLCTPVPVVCTTTTVSQLIVSLSKLRGVMHTFHWVVPQLKEHAVHTTDNWLNDTADPVMYTTDWVVAATDQVTGWHLQVSKWCTQLRGCWITKWNTVVIVMCSEWCT